MARAHTLGPTLHRPGHSLDRVCEGAEKSGPQRGHRLHARHQLLRWRGAHSLRRHDAHLGRAHGAVNGHRLLLVLRNTLLLKREHPERPRRNCSRASHRRRARRRLHASHRLRGGEGQTRAHRLRRLLRRRRQRPRRARRRHVPETGKGVGVRQRASILAGRGRGSGRRDQNRWRLDTLISERRGVRDVADNACPAQRDAADRRRS
mmetsp:Transcript_101112/g.309206  ORF Transcript_101112/g.309206 Transcript_101112/m.309206 type:complete len:206 (+) Transcript_101112:297-914(+)